MEPFVDTWQDITQGFQGQAIVGDYIEGVVHHLPMFECQTKGRGEIPHIYITHQCWPPRFRFRPGVPSQLGVSRRPGYHGRPQDDGPHACFSMKRMGDLLSQDLGEPIGIVRFVGVLLVNWQVPGQEIARSPRPSKR